MQKISPNAKTTHTLVLTLHCQLRPICKHTHTYPNAKSADRRRMMDERSWASKMGEEDDESGRR